MDIKCCICKKPIKEIYYSTPLSKEKQDYRLCVQCNDNLKKLDATSDVDIIERIGEYFNQFTFELDQPVQEEIDRRLGNKIITGKSKKALRAEMMLTTGFTFDGYRITKYHDVIFREVIVGIGFKTRLNSITDLFSNLTGDEYSALSERIQKIKSELREKVIQEAVNMGSNALIGIDFESSIPGGCAIMASMTATAVTIERIDR